MIATTIMISTRVNPFRFKSEIFIIELIAPGVPAVSTIDMVDVRYVQRLHLTFFSWDKLRVVSIAFAEEPCCWIDVNRGGPFTGAVPAGGVRFGRDYLIAHSTLLPCNFAAVIHRVRADKLREALATRIMTSALPLQFPLAPTSAR